MNSQWIVAVHKHVTTPLYHSHYEQLDFESGGRLPLTEHFSIRFWAFSYFAGELCARSNQLIMYFIALRLIVLVFGTIAV